MQKLPVIGDYFVRDVPPEDNVSEMMPTNTALRAWVDDSGSRSDSSISVGRRMIWEEVEGRYR